MLRYSLIPIALIAAGVWTASADVQVETWYKLGEDGALTSNLPKDSSGKGRDFVNAEGNSTDGVKILTTSAAPGSSKYYSFSGEATGFNDIGWDPPEDNVGVECWARAYDLSFTTGVTVGQVVWGTGHNQNGIGILKDDFGAGFVGVLGNVQYVGTGYLPASTNDWVHLAVVRDNGVTTFYVNGIAKSPTRTDSPVNSTVPYMASGGTLTNFAGAIDDARIFTFKPGEFYPNDLLFFQSTNTRPYVTVFKGSADGFTVKIKDKTTTVATNTIATTLNGSTTATAITKAGDTTTISYNSATLFPAGQVQTVVVTFQDSAQANITNTLTFTSPTYVAIPASLARAAGSVDTTQPGFKVRPYVTEAANPNSLAWTEDQVIGLKGPNLANLIGVDAGGFLAVPGVINFNIEAGTTDRGSFTNDVVFPGIPGDSGMTGNASMEAVAFLEFPAAGVYTMGVNSDDGFKVTVGKNPRDRFSLVLGQFDGGRGATDTLFNIAVSQAGIYPFRLLWENGNGELPNNQANCEWFTVLKDGTKVLVNDRTNPNAIKAYRAGALPAYVSRVAPAIGERGVLPSAGVEVDITDDGTQVTASSVKMALDNAALAAPTSVNKVGSVTTAKLTPASAFPVDSTHSAQVSFTDSASTSSTNSWQFTILSAYVPSGLWTAVGSGDATKRGFRVKTFQASYATQNELPIFDQLIHGVGYSDNVADLSGATQGEFVIDSTINLDQYGGDVGLFNASSGGYTDLTFPGIPGTTSSMNYYAMEALTFVEFPAAGIYTMGVNSDDGFRVTVADSTGPDFGGLRILGSAPYSKVYPTWPTYAANGGLFGGPLPRPYPAMAPLVKADDGTTTRDEDTLNSGDNNASYTFLRAAPTNSAQLKGSIAVTRRGGGITFAQKAKYLQDAGALAMIAVNRPDQATVLPFGMGGSDPSVTIPCVMIDWTEYSNFWAKVTTRADTTIWASLGEDNSPMLGQFDGGRGQGTPTLFSFYVPQAGLYPMRLLYYQGDGAASCEWFSVDSQGNNLLLNDTKPGALKTYRARTVASRGSMNAPTLTGDKVNISWKATGELQEADSLSGPWFKSADQGNPQVRTAAQTQKYFRLRVY